MVVEISGKIFKTFNTAKGHKGINILVPRGDGQEDTLTVFVATDKYKAGMPFKGKIEVFATTARELDVVFSQEKS
jgi:hypothetical protein